MAEEAEAAEEGAAEEETKAKDDEEGDAGVASGDGANFSSASGAGNGVDRAAASLSAGEACFFCISLTDDASSLPPAK
jgi:hypothetical protein